MKYILFMDSWRWFVRLPAKVLLAAVAVTLVTFPYPQLLLRHIEHWRNPNALIDAESPALEPLLASLEPEVTALGDDHEQILKTVESRVYKAVPYAWDWDTWGTADYMPTVEETLRLGKEDCDGRAVVAASVLRHFGYETELVTDFAHVWVKTDKGETMGPGGRKVVEGGKKGVAFNLAGLVELPNALALKSRRGRQKRRGLQSCGTGRTAQRPGFRGRGVSSGAGVDLAGRLLVALPQASWRRDGHVVFAALLAQWIDIPPCRRRELPKSGTGVAMARDTESPGVRDVLVVYPDTSGESCISRQFHVESMIR